MKLFSKTDRLGVAYFSNQACEKTAIHLTAPSYSIIHAYILWSSPSSNHTIQIETSGKQERFRVESSGLLVRATGLFMYSKEITSFVEYHVNTEYDVRSIEPAAESFQWHLIIVYRCPSQPVRHVCVFLQDQEEEQLWGALQSSLPRITASTNQLALVHVMGVGTDSHHVDSNKWSYRQRELQLTIEEEQIAPNSYEPLLLAFPNPVMIAQQYQLPATDMRLTQTADRARVHVNDVITCSTEIVNSGTAEALYVQYRTMLPEGTRLIDDSFTINGIPVPIVPDRNNVLTVILRNMPASDMLHVSYRIILISLPLKMKLYHSSVLDYHFYPEPDTLSVGNTPSNTVEYVVSSDERE